MKNMLLQILLYCFDQQKRIPHNGNCNKYRKQIYLLLIYWWLRQRYGDCDIFVFNLLPLYKNLTLIFQSKKAAMTTLLIPKIIKCLMNF